MMTPTLSSQFFTQEEIEQLKTGPIPRHIAIIPDGNRRWAKNQSEELQKGHRKGCDILFDVVEAARDLGVQTLTMYAFSTENWTRPPLEVEMLMTLLYDYVTEQREKMLEKQVRLRTIGDLTKLPERLQQETAKTVEITANCQSIDLVLALNYGGRDEIRRCFLRILDDYKEQKVDKIEISEELISRYLDTAPWGDPELLIRTGMERRISNFLLWQLSYTELYNPDVLWPDFTPRHLLESIRHFQKRNRRTGR